MILNLILSKKSFLLELISTFNFVKALKAKYCIIFWQICIYLKLQLWEALICQKNCIRYNEWSGIAQMHLEVTMEVLLVKEMSESQFKSLILAK